MAPRQRKDKALAWLPPRVYQRGGGEFTYYPPAGGSKVIAKKGARPDQVWEAYNAAIADIRPNSLKYFWDQYQESEQWKDHADATRIDYTQSSKIPLKVFAHTDCLALRAPHIRQYMDSRGKKSRTRANRELSWMSSMFKFAFERGLMPLNPCEGVKPFREQRRKHYVEVEHYNALYAVAPDVVRVAMELAYCAGLRQADVLKLQWSHVGDDGLLVVQQKTGKALSKDLSDRILAALKLARTLPKVSSYFVVHNKVGKKYTRSGFNAIWARYMAKIPEAQRFTFHDLRRRGITDAGGDKKFSGHKSDAQAAAYNVKPIKSPSH